MSNATQPVNATAELRPSKVVLISHSPLFYWWPVWAVGFLMAGLSYWDGHQVAFVPPGTVAERGVRLEGHAGPRDILVAPEGRPLPVGSESDDPKQPRLRLAASNNPGIIWLMTLCLVIVITHAHLRGMKSMLMILALVVTTALLALLGLWDPILRSIEVIDIHITASSYLAISVFLFLIWLLTVVVLDRLVYMIFTRGQLRVRRAVGDGEIVYDTSGMVIERQRDDVFRHWLLGFGTGDLIVRTSGTNPQQFEMPNVFGIGRKLALIQTMLQEREVVRGSR